MEALKNEKQSGDVYGAGDGKYLRRANLKSIVAGSCGSASVPSALVIFDAMDFFKEQSVLSKFMQSALAYVEKPSTSTFLDFTFVAIGIQNSPVHVAELEAAQRLLLEVEDSLGDLRATCRPRSASSQTRKLNEGQSYSTNLRDRLKPHIPPTQEAVGEFRQLVALHHPQPRDNRPTSDLQVVEVVQWKELRDLIISRFHRLTEILDRNNLLH
jgi:hypothetical protein